MPKKLITPVKGGWIKREAASGRFTEVVKTSGESGRWSAATSASVDSISARRSAALKRLADR